MLNSLIDHGHSMRRIAPQRGETGLFCMAGGAGYELRVNEVYSWDGLQRGSTPFAMIQHTISGEGRLDFAGVSHRVGPGETMLLTFPHANRYWLENGRRWQYFWISFTGREALRLTGAILSATGPILRPPAQAIDAMAGACLDLLTHVPETPGLVSGAAYRALMALYDTALGTREVAQTMPAPVQRALGYIENNLSSPIDVGLLARAGGQSRAHFVRQFTRAVGAAPSTYLAQKRMERAMRLLLATDHPIHTVADVCGFADANYFSKVFRRHQGVSPTEFRRAGRNR
jgi:AraC family transcriptional regulator